MNCDEARRHWNLYHDSEGEPELYFRINEHLAACPACSRWFFQQSRLEDRVTKALAPGAATPALWSAVLRRSGVMRQRPVRKWIFFGGGFALAASLLVAVLVWQSVERRGGPSLSELAADWHERLSEGAEPLDFTSASDLEVEAYLRERVNFPVRCPPRKDTGFEVAGAGVSRLDSENAAYVIGSVGGQPVSVFIMAQESLGRFPHQLAAVRSEGLHRCREGRNEMVMAEVDRNIVVVVGRGESDVLTRVLQAYGSYPHGRPAI